MMEDQFEQFDVERRVCVRRVGVFDMDVYVYVIGIGCNIYLGL